MIMEKWLIDFVDDTNKRGVVLSMIGGWFSP
jgi:hypothetical protein